MSGKRRLFHEFLEQRQLLAADALLLADAPESDTGDAVARVESIILEDGERGDPAIPGFSPYFDYYLGWGPDLVQENRNQLFVVDQHPQQFHPGSQLVVFERGADGSLAHVEAIKLDFHVNHMIVLDDQVLLVGTEPVFPWLVTDGTTDDGVAGDILSEQLVRPVPEPPNTVVLTVNLGDQPEVIRQDFDFRVQFLDQEDERVVIVASTDESEVIAAIYPPPEIRGLLNTYQITNDGLRETASTPVPLFGDFQVSGDTLIHTRVIHHEIVFFQPDTLVDGESGELFAIRAPDDRNLPHFEPTVVVTQYSLVEDVIEEVTQVELGTGFFQDVGLFDGGKTAIVVRSTVDRDGGSTRVDILDLSSGRMQLFESVPASGRPLEVYADYTVLTDHDGTLFIVDTNQSIDLAAENRVKRLGIPDRLRAHGSVHRVSGDRIVMMADRLQPSDAAGELKSDLRAEPADVLETVLLTISLPDARIVAKSSLGDGHAFGGPNQFFEIDSATDRFAMLMHRITDAGLARVASFVFGSLDESGQFVRQGSIPVGHWLEIDVDPDRLIARETDRLVEYRWENFHEPIVTPLGDPDPEIEAVDDEFTIYSDGDEHWLDVLSNDLVHHPLGRGTKIVELIGAPEGARIIAPNLVSIPGAALEDVDSLRFEYVISDGRTESRAAVEVINEAISEEEIQTLIEAVRSQAAADFNVDPDDVVVTSVERFFDRVLPIVPPDDPTARIDFSPGILVTLVVPEASALYAANLDFEIIQLHSSDREYLVEFSLQALDEEGERLKRLVTDQEFWLEFSVDDLRSAGLGVYAAFLDLELPENIELTGPVEYGEGFTSILQGGFDGGEIDELGAISTQIESPGGGVQTMLRIKARAVSAGQVTLKPDYADKITSETLLRGVDEEIHDVNVRLKELTLTIVDPPEGDSLDADGSGEVSSVDALVVINFLRQFGSTTLAELADHVAEVRGEGENTAGESMTEMKRYDTNRNGTITSLDALVVINHLQQVPAVDAALTSDVVGSPIAASLVITEDDDEETTGVLF